MRNNKIAMAHPGRMGDLLYILPLARWLHKQTELLIDVWTSKYCIPTKELFEYQDCIDKFIVSEDYVLDNWGCGGQPPYINVPFTYEVIFQCGFTMTPDKFLPHWIAERGGIDIDKIPRVQYQYKESLDSPPTFDKPYYVLDTRGMTAFNDLFLDFACRSPYPVVLIGGAGNFNEPFKELAHELIMEGETKIYDATGINFLDTLTWIAKSSGFIGLMSSQLVLANGFDIPKVAVHDGRSWDMRHVQYSPTNFYPVNPSTEEVLNLLK